MTAGDVLAVVVSYNGEGKTRLTVDALRRQVGHILIVDNGSRPESLDILDQLAQTSGVTVERLGENRGVGYALNRGVSFARAANFAWLLTMDQDSVADRAMVEAYGAAAEREPALVSLAPAIENNGRVASRGDHAIDCAITSGNLVRVTVFDAVGLYDEGFFIDAIDFDFSLRLRRAGHSVVRVSRALMQHSLGDAVRLPGFVRRFYAQHAAVRRYYMARNFLYLAQRHFTRFPGFIFKLGVAHVIHMTLIGVLDPAPLRSYRAIARGIRDYFAGRTGPYAARP